MGQCHNGNQVADMEAVGSWIKPCINRPAALAQMSVKVITRDCLLEAAPVEFSKQTAFVLYRHSLTLLGSDQALRRRREELCPNAAQRYALPLVLGSLRFPRSFDV